VKPSGASSGVVLSPERAVIAMPFDSGDGSADSPFYLRPIDPAEFEQYPDLLAGHPLNRAGVDETARMLDNIEGLRVLYDRTGGVYGMSDSLSLAYLFTYSFDLADYAAAYDGLGWRPIGDADALINADGTYPPAAHKFGGQFGCPLRERAIEGLLQTRDSTAGRPMRLAGLFGYVDDTAFLHNFYVANADISITGQNFSGPDAHTLAGCVAGYCRAPLEDLRVDYSAVAAQIDEAGSGEVRAGGAVGWLAGGADRITVSDVNVLAQGPSDVRIAGGVAGYVSAESGELSFTECSYIQGAVSGATAGGLFGTVTNESSADVTISSCSSQYAAMLGTSQTGGFIGVLSPVGGATTITGCNVMWLAANQEGDASANVGGFIGAVQPVSGAIVIDTVQTIGDIHGGSSVGGLIGSAVVQGGSSVTVRNITANCGIRATGGSLGGMYGTGGAVNGGVFLTGDSIVSGVGIASDSSSPFVGGLVGYASVTGAAPTSFRVENCQIAPDTVVSGGPNTGGLVGGAFGAPGNLIAFEDCASEAAVSGGQSTGGFGGLVANASLINCATLSAASVTPVGVSMSTYGGLVGSAQDATQFLSCHADVSFDAQHAIQVGGLIGHIIAPEADHAVLIRSCFATGNILNGGDHTGGLIGLSSRPSTRSAVVDIIDCYATGAVQGAAWVGGLAGRVQDVAMSLCHAEGTVTSTGARVGGLIGLVDAIAITSQADWSANIGNCYATGAVSCTLAGDNYVCGLIGQAMRAHVYQCYATGNVTGIGAYASSLGEFIYYTLVEDCYALGNVSSTGSGASGIVATQLTGTTITRCYAAAATISGADYVGGILGGGPAAPDHTVSDCISLIASEVRSTGSNAGRVMGRLLPVPQDNFAIDATAVVINGTPRAVTSNINGVDGQSITNDAASILAAMTTLGWDTTNVWDTSTLYTLTPPRPTLLFTGAAGYR